MLYKNFVFKYLLVIFFGFLIFFVDSLEFVNDLFTKCLILSLVVFKSSFFFIQSFKKIIEATKNDIAYYEFLVFMSVNISLIVLSFGIDFLCLYQVEPASFKGIPGNINFNRTAFELLYFSLLNFSNFGFGDVVPISIVGKIIVTIEIVISFITIIFILSDFVSLKESFAQKEYSFSLKFKKKSAEEKKMKK